MLTDIDGAIKAGTYWPPADKKRIAMCDKVDMLLDGNHGAVFTESFMRLMRDDASIVEIDLPWVRKVRLIFPDLLCGEPGTIRATDEEQQDYLDDLVRRLKLWPTIHEACGDTVSYGDGLLKLKRRNGQIALANQPPSYWFPVVSQDDVRDIEGHVLAWRINVGTTETPKWVGRAEKHGRGWIETMEFEFDYSGEKISRIVSTSGRVNTGVKGFLVFHAPNWRTSKELFGHSTFDDADSILSELEVRISQMAKVLDKHSDPGMYGPESALEQDPVTGEWRVKGGQFYSVSEGESPPGYTTWDGQLFPNIELIKILREELYAATDTCPALFGKLEAGMAESGSALKRLLISPLAAVNRLRLTYDGVVRDVLATAAEMEGQPLGHIDIGWKDGLPDDPMEAAQVENMRVAAGNTSISSSVQRLDNIDREDLEKELARIKADQALNPASAPPPAMVTLPERV
jgi:hypothetical protein